MPLPRDMVAASGMPLDRNAKARIMVFARAWRDLAAPVCRARTASRGPRRCVS